MTESLDGGPPSGSDAAVPAVFFLSDYGTADEFVGVVHAVLHRLAPAVPVIDLSHQVPPFDVTAGAALLARSGPHLGPGVVLAVVDPGVGTDRRAVALEVPPGGPTWLVGPDNGLLVPLAVSLGGVQTAAVLDPARLGTAPPAGTFDGRDLFAPAAAFLARGGVAGEIGTPVDVSTLVVAPAGGAEGLPPGRSERTESEVPSAVTWIDRFGNAQLALAPDALSGIGLTLGATARIILDRGPLDGGPLDGGPLDGGTSDRGASDRDTSDQGEDQGRRILTARWVEAFGQLGRGELGLLEDANGQVALVMDRASAAVALRLAGPGAVVRIAAGPPGGVGA
jgi:hypothetical protein